MGEKSFFIKQKPLSLKVRYEILDHNRKKLYEVIGSFFSNSFSPLVLIDGMEKELIWIKKTPFKFLPRYEISDEKGTLAIVKRKFGFFKRRMILETGEDTPYSLQNNYRMDDCHLIKGGQTMASIRRKGIGAWRTYEVRMDEAEDEEFVLALAATIDRMFIWSQGS